MFSFEGDFKTRPKVSLGGASRKYSIQRSEFDRCANLAQSGGTVSTASGANLTLLVRQLLFFYRQKEDSKRLIWMCQNLIKQSSQFVKQLDGPDRLTCLFQIKRLLGLCCRLLQNCNDDSLNVALPMRMLEVFSSENTYLPVLQDANYVASLFEQILHYMVQKGYYRSLYLLINNKLPSSIEYSDVSRVPIAKILLENVLKPLHFTYSSCPEGARQQIFAAFTEEFLAAPFTDQIFHFIIPALADVQTLFPYELFLNALLTESRRSRKSDRAPWLFYFVLTVGETYLGSLSEEGLLVYLRVLQTFLSQLPVSATSAHCQDATSDSEDEDEEISKMMTIPGDGRISVQYITEECLKKLDTKQQTNTLLNMVWRDSASEEVFTLMASICHTLMVQHRMMVPKVRSMVPLLQVISRGSPMSLEDSSRIIPLFYLFSSLFSHSLISIHDNEFFGDPIEGQRQSSMMPFTLEELVILSRCLRDACLGIIKLAYPETKPEVREEYIAAFRSVGVTTNTEMQQCIQTEQKRWIQLFKVITNLVKMLKSRDTRRNFCPPNHWLSEQENIKADKIFQRLIYADKQEVQGDGPFLDGINVTIRRNYIYEDAYDKLSPENEPDLKKRIRVHLLNAHGLDEAGIDGGGIFREFLNELLKSGFNPNQGFFKTTNEGLLYPNPAAQMLVGDSYARHYYFLGRMLGKQKQVGSDSPSLSGSALSSIYRSFRKVSLSCRDYQKRNSYFYIDCSKFDKQAFHNRNTQLPKMAGAFMNLYLLTFNISSRQEIKDNTNLQMTLLYLKTLLLLRAEDFNSAVALYENMLVELPFASFFLSKLLGTSADVDIHHLASLDPEMYKNLLFLKSYEGDVEELGLNFTVVNNDLGEAQVVELKPGGKDIPVTSANRIAYIHLVADYRLNKQIRQHCLAFRQGLANVVNLECLRMFDQQEIQELYPAFCIHNGGSDLDRLPTASTCMNLLKLPEFYDENLMRSKLLYAIECAAGFELS
ncbi:Ubiquitin-protein ligase E3C [Chelonia mydas]|uniref:HECT-type E3 ubiquitin transferase n=1 Tax=Chelonia mydas TaxID=8469 RepID=M7BTD2_CHEMY|nr:Ubiquitin-protein ligase E3C [Chelonia mydas]